MNITRNILGWVLITVYFLVGLVVFLIGLIALILLILFVGYIVIAPFLLLNHLYDGWQLFWLTLLVMPIWILAILSEMAKDYYES